MLCQCTNTGDLYLMDIELYLFTKQSHCETNAADQRHLGNPASAAYWQGRALSYKDMLDALKSGIITQDGIVKLDFSRFVIDTQ